MEDRRFFAFHPMEDIRDIADMGGRLYEDGTEEELEPGYIMGWTVNNSTLGGSL